MLSIRRLAPVVLIGLILPCFGILAGDLNTEINGLKVVPSAGKIRLEISKTGDVEFKAFMVYEPDRLVVDCIGARYDLHEISGNTENPFIHQVRTSQFQVDPVMISRVVVDLKKKVDYRLFEEGGVQVVELTDKDAGMPAQKSGIAPMQVSVKQDAGQSGVVSAAAMGPVLPLIKPVESRTSDEPSQPSRAESKPGDWIKTQPAGKSTQKSPERNPSSAWVVEDKSGGKADEASPAKAEKENVSSALVIRETAPAAKVETAGNDDALPWAESYVKGAAASGGGAPMGPRKITIDAQGADIKTVLRTISDFSGVNIVAGKDVKGEVYVHIKDTPWEEALEVLLRAHSYGYRKEHGMIRVAELTKLMKEELEVQTAEKKIEDQLPLVTRVIFVNNSNAEELKDALQNMTSQRGKIDVDLGSNSLIVTDIEKNIDKISELIETLDKKTFQVDINAKLVEVDVEASQEMGINWGFLNLHKSGFGGTGSAEMTADIPLSSGTLKFGTVRSWGELNAMLQVLEKENKANIISNPRITTMDNREASILVGKEIPLIVADEAGNPITELTKIGIMLRVIPHVNSDKTITLDLHPQVSELQSESTAQGGVIIATAEADTRIIIKNGDTAVIGGLIKKVDTDVITGIPYLKDLPYLGRIFSSKSKVNKKQELVIFVTPTIVE